MLLDSILGIGNKLIDKLIPDPEAKAKAQMDLAKMAQDGELAKMANDTKLFEVEQQNTTDRWQADMSSDSWLSKNIRPMALIGAALVPPVPVTVTEAVYIGAVMAKGVIVPPVTDWPTKSVINGLSSQVGARKTSLSVARAAGLIVINGPKILL